MNDAPFSTRISQNRSEEHTSELQSLRHLVCRLLLEKKKATSTTLHRATAPDTTSSAHQTPAASADKPCRMVLRLDQLLEPRVLCGGFFFFNDTATTEIYTLSLHDALPISVVQKTPVGRTSASSGKEMYRA